MNANQAGIASAPKTSSPVGTGSNAAAGGTNQSNIIDFGPFHRQEGRIPALARPNALREDAIRGMRAEFGLPVPQVAYHARRLQPQPHRTRNMMLWIVRVVMRIRQPA